MEAKFHDENGSDGLGPSYNNTSRHSNLVEVCLLPIYRPLCELCDGSQVHEPQARHHVCFLRQCGM